jgi:hypothetical protein
MEIKSEADLQEEKVLLEAKIAVAAAKTIGLDLDPEVVAGLIKRNVKFDRSYLTFLQKFAENGDVGQYLKDQLAKKGALSVADEETVNKSTAPSKGQPRRLLILKAAPTFIGTSMRRC